MGNKCFENKLKASQTIISKSGILKKICGEKEISFWKELQKLGFAQISNIISKGSKSSVEFRYPEFVFENYISLSQIVQYHVVDNNFLYFIQLFEITIAIIDFIQIIFTLKHRYGINETKFFFINFEKFYLMKEKGSSEYSKLVYIDEKLNDPYTIPEILYKEDNTGLLSFSISEDLSGVSVQKMISTFNKSSNMGSTEAFDLNSYFYSNCNERYQIMRKNYSLLACERFYSENIMNFVRKFLIKKTVIQHLKLDHQFHNFRTLFRRTVKYYFKSEDTYSFLNTKILLTNFYINNFEFGLFKENINQMISDNDNDLIDKIISFQQSGINFKYGECDVEDPPEGYHKFAFIHDYIANNSNDSANIRKTLICISCADRVLKKKTPENKENSINVRKFSNEVSSRYTFIDFNFFLKYYCYYFENDKKTTQILNEIGDEIYIYKNNKYYITFERTYWNNKDDDSNEEVLNLDYVVKNNYKRKK